ncbi:hypothetical protein [Mucilaginibacter celer]|uniref:hypothetical protein n=1 Tax=Mucilaginibacter celer TaxID=2305508 RepID=UPI001968F402|nr:hypothetical protein [Mucilaginibacter celer]
MQNKGLVAINTSNISAVHRRRLTKNGFLKEVLKGWYIPSSPDETQDDSTSWYANYWDFCSRYITEKYGDEYIVSPDLSLQFHSGNQTVPVQLVIRSPEASNFKTDLQHHTSLFHMRGELPPVEHREKQNGIMIYSLPAALVFSGQSIFTQNPTDARAALAMIGDSSEVLSILLKGGHTTIAGRLCGSFRNI